MKIDLLNTKLNLQPPQNPISFQRLCARLYGAAWNDHYIIHVGHDGKEQFGLDLLGTDHRIQKRVGIQCKNYKDGISKGVLDQILEKLDKDNRFAIDHLVIAAPLPGDAAIQAEVEKQSSARRAKGKCSVSIDYLDDIFSKIRYVDQIGILNSFPEITFGFGVQILSAQHPIDHEVSRIQEWIRSEHPSREKPWITFDQYITGHCLKPDNELDRQWVALPIPGYDPRSMNLQLYIKDVSSLFPACARTVDIEGFDLHLSNRLIKHEIRRTFRKKFENLTGEDDRYYSETEEFTYRAGFLEPAVQEVMTALRKVGCIRWAYPTTALSTTMKNVLIDAGFLEHTHLKIMTSFL